MPTDPLQSLVGGAPLPTTPVIIGLEPEVAIRKQDTFNRQLIDYVRRLMQQVSMANVQELILPLTTKGDLLSRNSTTLARLGVGSDGDILTADSGESVGLKWETPSGGSGITIIKNTAPDEGMAATNGEQEQFTDKATITSADLAVGSTIFLKAWGYVEITDFDPGDNMAIGIHFVDNTESETIGFTSQSRIIYNVTESDDLYWELEAEINVRDSGSITTCSTLKLSADLTDATVNGRDIEHYSRNRTITGFNTAGSHEIAVNVFWTDALLTVGLNLQRFLVYRIN